MDKEWAFIGQKKEMRFYQQAKEGPRLAKSVKSSLHHKLQVSSAAYAPSESLLAVLSQDCVSLWRIGDKGPKKLKSLNPTKQGNLFTSVAFSFCQSFLLTVCKDGSVLLWNSTSINDDKPNDVPQFDIKLPFGFSKVVSSGSLIVAFSETAPLLHSVQLPELADATFSLASMTQHGLTQATLMRDPSLCAVLTVEGQFYILQGVNLIQPSLQVLCKIHREKPLKMFAISPTQKVLVLAFEKSKCLIMDLNM